MATATAELARRDPVMAGLIEMAGPCRLKRAGLEDAGAPLAMHSLRDTFASHLIIELGRDAVLVSR